MAKKQPKHDEALTREHAPTDSPAGTAALTPVTETAAPATDRKLTAFTRTVDAVATLTRPDRVDVLRAVAQFYGLSIPMAEPPR